MLLTVRQAAERLTVSPHTVRRWTATGFLSCSRTPGGHRRIDERDVADLAAQISNGKGTTAQLARERELETYVRTSLAIARQVDVNNLLVEVAEQMTNLLECNFCRISEYDARTGMVSILSEFNRLHGPRPFQPYPASVFPVVVRVLEQQVWALTNISDADADVDELRIMNRDSDKSLLVLPMVYNGKSIGLIEVIDHEHERHYTARQLRFAMAVAEQAAVALTNAKAFGELKRSCEDSAKIREAVKGLAESLGELLVQESVAGVLEMVVRIAGDICRGLMAVAKFGDWTVGASRVPGRAEMSAQSGLHTLDAEDARVVTSTANSGGQTLTLTASFRKEDAEVFASLLDVVTTTGAAVLRLLVAA